MAHETPTIKFYLLTLNKALKRVDASRRGMSSGMVWLNLIPLFNLGWHIYRGANVGCAGEGI